MTLSGLSSSHLLIEILSRMRIYCLLKEKLHVELRCFFLYGQFQRHERKVTTNTSFTQKRFKLELGVAESNVFHKETTFNRKSEGPVHCKWKKFENAALFLQLGLPSALIHQENGALRKRSWNRKYLKTPASRSRVDEKHLLRVVSEHFEDDNLTIMTWVPRPRFFKHKSKMTDYFSFSNLSGFVWTENIFADAFSEWLVTER